MNDNQTKKKEISYRTAMTFIQDEMYYLNNTEDKSIIRGQVQAHLSSVGEMIRDPTIGNSMVQAVQSLYILARDRLRQLGEDVGSYDEKFYSFLAQKLNRRNIQH